MATADQVWLETPDGTRLRVRPGGLVAGRDPRCDLLLDAPGASRQHALFVCTPRGPRALALGRVDLVVNGTPARTHPLRRGDRVSLPGLELLVATSPDAPEPPRWTVQVGETRLGVPDGGLRLGATGDLGAAGWEGHVLLEPGPARLRVSSAVPFRRNGARRTPGSTVECLPGDVLEPEGGGAPLVVGQVSSEASVTLPDGADLPTAVELRLFPRGGRLTVLFPASSLAVFLPERRFAMVAGLLQPPRPYAPGEPVPDEVLLPLVWPRDPRKTRVDLNVLLRRLRLDLDAASIPSRLVARGEGGGSTRFQLAPGAKVTFER